MMRPICERSGLPKITARYLEKGARFYDAVMAEYGGTRMMETDRAIGWAFPDGGPSIGITLPFDGGDLLAGGEPVGCGFGVLGFWGFGV